MSNSVWPQRRQPTRLPRPWDSPGKNTGVGCHFLLQCMKVKSEIEVSQLCPTLCDPMDCSLPGSSVHGISQARVLEWGAIAFSMQAHSLPLSHQGSPVSRTAPHTKISQLKSINSSEVKKKTCYILTLESKLLLLWITLVFNGSFLAIVYNC